MPKQILHNAHSQHPLLLVDTHSTSFRCNGCGCQGVGFRYRCQTCNFDLHEHCATCPPTASFAFHGQHTLELEPAVFPEDPRSCDLCGTSINGMHYRCRPCGFDVHPVCSQLPVYAVSPLHPAHLVTLTVAAPRKCTHCGANCLWRYRCNPCGINLHPKCLLGRTDDTPLKIPRDN
ncbi:protein VACUOLELESS GAMETOPHYTES-like [Miscanthus floridulus]|uniref:protein VACUOLELESS GAMETOPHYTES-like n=1 Tax=Miscanthus floridulus TaxID=154761 RepID=UPI00345A0F3E